MFNNFFGKFRKRKPGPHLKRKTILLHRRQRIWRSISVVLIILVLLSIVVFGRNLWVSTHQTPQNLSLILDPLDICAKHSPPVDNGNGIGISQSDYTGESIGISDGSFVFEQISNIERANLICQGSLDLKDNPSGAELSWTQALQILPQEVADNSNDAEILIYREDQHVLDICKSPCHLITFIVGTILTGDYEDIVIGHDILQGAYEVQEEFNRHHLSTLDKVPPPVQVRLLIANFGSDVRSTEAASEDKVMHQITEAVSNHSLAIKGVVMGLPSILPSAADTLKQLNVPVILATGFSESQMRNATNIFSVSASIEREGSVGARYVDHIMQKRHVVLFYNPGDQEYSSILQEAFTNQLKIDGTEGILVDTETYLLTDKNLTSDIESKVKKAVDNYHADLIYFAGDATTADKLLTSQFVQKTPNLQVMGGDELYDLGGYTGGYRNLLFTASAFPDVWEVLGKSSQEPQFLNEYRLLYAGWPLNRIYGYSRPDNDAILSFDAVSILLEASMRASSSFQNEWDFTPSQLLDTLDHLNDFQGFSGNISFDINNNPLGNPVNKPVLLLQVNGGYTMLVARNGLDGCLLRNFCSTI